MDELKSNIHKDKTLTLIKLDAKHLMDRVSGRVTEYVTIFGLKRDRSHFAEIFFSRYETFTMKELEVIPSEIMVQVDEFYNIIEQLRWYLGHTEDMPNTVEDIAWNHIRKLKKVYNNMIIYLDAELAHLNSEEKDEFIRSGSS